MQEGMYGERAEFYDPIYHWKDYQGEAERLRNILKDLGIPEGSRVLEAGCGTGSHMAFLRSWFQISGFDLSEAMLAVARKKLPGIPLFRADMTDFQIPEAAALLCLFSAIGYVYPEARLRSAAGAFARAVRPGGALIVEPWLTEESFTPGHISMHTYDGPELKLSRMAVGRKEGALSVIDFHWMALRKGTTDAERFSERHTTWLCPLKTLLAAFREAGFEVRYEPDGLMKDRGLLIGRRRA